jgi:hypothetical protein
MRIAGLFALLLAAVLGWTGAAPGADDIATAQGVIRAQEQAFGRDDAAAAYSYAAPAIKQIFPSESIFMSMVQNGYAPVYRHRSFEFGEAREQRLDRPACAHRRREWHCLGRALHAGTTG